MTATAPKAAEPRSSKGLARATPPQAGGRATAATTVQCVGSHTQGLHVGRYTRSD